MRMTCSVVRSLTLTDPTHRQSPKTRSTVDAEGSSTAQGLQVYYQSADSSNFASPVHSQFSAIGQSVHVGPRQVHANIGRHDVAEINSQSAHVAEIPAAGQDIINATTESSV